MSYLDFGYMYLKVISVCEDCLYGISLCLLIFCFFRLKFDVKFVNELK